jgi:hypothetical protein
MPLSISGFVSKFLHLMAAEDGDGMGEYGLIIFITVLGAVAALRSAGNAAAALYALIAQQVANAV